MQQRAFVAGALSVLVLSAVLGLAPMAAARDVLLGRSVQGRAIVAHVLGANSASRKILLVGCIHGNECAGRSILAALARRPVPAGIQLWLLGELNPDGSAAASRQNAHGVDLNRNFPFRWRAISDPTYNSGPHPGSEPETRIAMRLIRRLRPAVTVWYHQHEDLLDMAGADRGLARRYAELAGLRATCLPFLPGTATSWSNHTFPGTSSVVVEVRGGAVSRRALARHLRALHALARGAPSGSRGGCS
jgi:protein MpaA